MNREIIKETGELKLRKLTPILWTKNLQDTISFYVDILGFKCIRQVDRFASLIRDNVNIMIVIPVDEPEDCRTNDNAEDLFPKPKFTGSIYIETDHVDELWEQIKDKVNVKYEIGNQEWLVRDFSIFDNNGYEIVFGQEIKG